MKKIPYLHILLFICAIGILSVPTLVFAQATTKPITDGFLSFKTIIDTFTQTIVRSLATLFATAAMVAFFFGIVQFIWGSRDGDATKAKNGKNFMLWGLIALFVMFSVWGIVNYAQRIFGIQGQNTIIIPQIELGNGKAPTNSGSQGLPINRTIYYCPDGTPYYNRSDYKTACTSSASTGASCSTFTDATTCQQQSGCTWSNAELICSQ